MLLRTAIVTTLSLPSFATALTQRWRFLLAMRKSTA
ncbi:hypothetical protein RDI58_005068 [Solanum bulbocastanum]|uniref:Uncharacterized protein n=1 Tax=Solanum bulbocastanum TaxID=147425 RepID=A0AAN8YM86_SOLBU